MDPVLSGSGAADSKLESVILNSINDRMPPAPIPFHYKLGLAGVTLGMILLPLIYIGLIVTVGWLLAKYAVAGTAVFEGARGRSGVGALMIYLGPLVAGGILILFMIKPLFAGRSKRQEPCKAARGSERLLYAFVQRICDAVGAPAPTEIHLTCDINASASFKRGPLSNDLVLTIGLPLAAGLSLRQFAGVLAHEFGHFTQQAGMRMTYIIRAISFWFVRVVYERDAWDELLVEWSRENDIRIGIIFYAARFCVWITRKILWVLMFIGHGLSCFMLRQMEYDADRCEAWLAGSDEFAKTATRLRLLGVASNGAHSDLKRFWDEGRLADDFPGLVLANDKQVPAAAKEKIEKFMREEKTGTFDTHPSDSDRTGMVNRQNSGGIFGRTHPPDTERVSDTQRNAQPGIVSADLPAAVLFSDFAATSRRVSKAYYEEGLGLKLKPENVIPLAELLGRQNEEAAATKTLYKVLGEPPCEMRPVPFPGIFIEAPANAADAVAAIKTLREQLLAGRASYKTAKEAWNSADKLTLAVNILTTSGRLDTKDTDLPDVRMDEAHERRREATATKKSAAEKLEPFETLAGRRISHALSLLANPELATSLPEAQALRAEGSRLLPVTVMLGNLLGSLIEVRDAHVCLMSLLMKVNEERTEELFKSIQARADTLRRKLMPIHDKLGTVEYPFDHAKGKITLRQFALIGVPPSSEIGELAQASGEVLDKLPPLYFRLLSRLAMIAITAEIAAGLPAVPDEQVESPNLKPETAAHS